VAENLLDQWVSFEMWFCFDVVIVHKVEVDIGILLVFSCLAAFWDLLVFSFCLLRVEFFDFLFVRTHSLNLPIIVGIHIMRRYCWLPVLVCK